MSTSLNQMLPPAEGHGMMVYTAGALLVCLALACLWRRRRGSRRVAREDDRVELIRV